MDLAFWPCLPWVPSFTLIPPSWSHVCSHCKVGPNPSPHPLAWPASHPVRLNQLQCPSTLQWLWALYFEELGTTNIISLIKRVSISLLLKPPFFHWGKVTSLRSCTLRPNDLGSDWIQAPHLLQVSPDLWHVFYRIQVPTEIQWCWHLVCRSVLRIRGDNMHCNMPIIAQAHHRAFACQFPALTDRRVLYPYVVSRADFLTFLDWASFQQKIK